MAVLSCGDTLMPLIHAGAPSTLLSHAAMTFVPSLQAIVLMDGDALVMHGATVRTSSPTRQASLANDPLSSDAIDNIIEQLLPEESQRVLKEIGATQCVLPEDPLYPRERFSVVAARGGDDVWVEIRRTGLRGGTATARPRHRRAQRLHRRPLR